MLSWLNRLGQEKRLWFRNPVISYYYTLDGTVAESPTSTLAAAVVRSSSSADGETDMSVLAVTRLSDDSFYRKRKKGPKTKFVA